MATLLEQIQEGAVDSKADIGEVLRRCQVLASRLGHPEFEQWVQKEVQGYRSDDALPEYRTTNVIIEGHFVSHRGDQIGPVPIPPGALPERARSLFVVKFLEPIGSYTHLLDGDGHPTASLPSGVLPGIKYFKYAKCLKAWQAIPISAISAMIETVRTKVLSFVLEIEKTNPKAGNKIGGEIPQDQVNQIFQTTINGPVGNVAAGSTGVSQVATVNVAAGDFKSLSKALQSHGVGTEEIESLREAIKADPATVPDRKSLGPRVLGWLGRQAIRVAVEMPAGLTAEILIRLLMEFYGHH